MKSIRDISIQKLFAITLVLKVGASFLGWKLRDPWILGFTAPLLFMCAYIVLGYYRRDNEVTDEKFADTCYYLGFLFTITSIIFSLFDLPHIGAKIQDIAVRFGAAMVSTVLGLAVRVYLVSFKKDVTDALRDAEDAVLDTTRKFTEQLTVALERLRDFEVQVDTAAKSSVERVNLQVEALSKNHADKLTSFFEDLTTRNQGAFTTALAEVKSSSQKLAESVDGYSLGMRANLGSIESKVVAFADAVTDRLKTTTFPDDYFAQHLSSPLSQLKDSSSALATGIKGTLHEVSESTAVLATALKKLKSKATATEESLDAVLHLTQQQQAALQAAQSQVVSLGELGITLRKIDETLTATLSGMTSSNGLAAALSQRVGQVVADGVESRKAIETALLGVTDSLKSQLVATGAVVSSLNAGTAASKESTERLTRQLDEVLSSEASAVRTLETLEQQATSALSRADNAVARLQGLVRQISALDAAIRMSGSKPVSVGSSPEAEVLGISAPILAPQPFPSLPAAVPGNTVPPNPVASTFVAAPRPPAPPAQAGVPMESSPTPGWTRPTPPTSSSSAHADNRAVPGLAVGVPTPQGTDSIPQGLAPTMPQIQVPRPDVPNTSADGAGTGPTSQSSASR